MLDRSPGRDFIGGSRSHRPRLPGNEPRSPLMNWPDTHRHPNPEMILLPHEKARPGVTTAAGEANAREAARLQGDAVRIGLADIERAREQLTERIAMWAVALEGCTSRPAYLHAKMDYLADLVSLLEFLLRTMTSAPRYDRMEAAVIEHQLELTKIELRTVTLTVAKDPVAAEYGRQLAAQAARYEIGGLSAGSGAWQERSAARAGLGMASAEIDALQRKLRLKQLLQAVAMAEDEENKLRSRPRRHTALGAQPQRRATQYDSEKQNLFSDDLLGVLTGAAGRQLRAQINDDPLSAGAGATGRMTAAECVRVLTARSDRLVSATEGALRGEASHLQDDILRRANDLRLTMGMPIIDAPARDEDPWLPSAMASADARSPLHHTTAARAAGVAPSSVLPLSLMGSPLRDPNRPQVILRDANDKAAARTALKDAVDAQLATTLAARLREAQRMGSEGVDVDIIARALSGEGDCVLPNIIAGLGVDGLVEALSPGVQRLQRDAHRHAEKAAAAGERAKWLAALGPALTPDEERELECARSDRDIEYLQALCDARMAALRHAMSPVQAVGIATSMAGVGPGPVTGHAGMRVANPSLAFLPTQGAHVVPSTEATYDAPSVAERVVRMKTQPGGAVDKQEAIALVDSLLSIAEANRGVIHPPPPRARRTIGQLAGVEPDYDDDAYTDGYDASPTALAEGAAASRRRGTTAADMLRGVPSDSWRPPPRAPWRGADDAEPSDHLLAPSGRNVTRGRYVQEAFDHGPVPGTPRGAGGPAGGPWYSPAPPTSPLGARLDHASERRFAPEYPGMADEDGIHDGEAVWPVGVSQPRRRLDTSVASAAAPRGGTADASFAMRDAVRRARAAQQKARVRNPSAPGGALRGSHASVADIPSPPPRFRADNRGRSASPAMSDLRRAVAADADGYSMPTVAAPRSRTQQRPRGALGPARPPALRPGVEVGHGVAPRRGRAQLGEIKSSQWR